MGQSHARISWLDEVAQHSQAWLAAQRSLIMRTSSDVLHGGAMMQTSQTITADPKRGKGRTAIQQSLHWRIPHLLC